MEHFFYYHLLVCLHYSSLLLKFLNCRKFSVFHQKIMLLQKLWLLCSLAVFQQLVICSVMLHLEKKLLWKVTCGGNPFKFWWVSGSKLNVLIGWSESQRIPKIDIAYTLHSPACTLYIARALVHTIDWNQICDNQRLPFTQKSAFHTKNVW